MEYCVYLVRSELSGNKVVQVIVSAVIVTNSLVLSLHLSVNMKSLVKCLLKVK